MKKSLFLFALTFSFLLQLSAQSLRINELSNGASGSKEYVELVVIGTPLTSCNQTPVCFDARGWIVDDNNGYFSGGPIAGTGIATGAIRFANNPFWECLLPGTIIVIYNDADPGAALPPNDNSNTDQNCKLVLPVSSTLFERHDSQPAIGNAQYATTGWVAGGNWNTIGLANSADGMQIYAPTNTTVPVHGVSYGSNLNVNPIVYFAGAGGGLVFSCLNNVSSDFSLQTNWLSASATTGETPGTFNSTSNETYISSLNLNCSTPLTITATPQDESCTGACDGEVSIVISGGQTPYGLSTWSNGSSGNQLGSLCQGTYTVTVTDAGGCTATETITIQSGAGLNLTTSGDQSICSGQSTILSATANGTLTWNQGLGSGTQFTVSPTQTTTYTVTAASGGCQATQDITITVTSPPTLSVSANEDICSGETASITATSTGSITWNEGLPASTSHQVSPSQTTVYTATATSNGCSISADIVISVSPLPTVDAGANSSICAGQTATLTATGATNYVWDNGVTNGVGFTPTSTTTYTVVGTNAAGCSATDQVTITVSAAPTVDAGMDTTVCLGQSVTLTATGNATNYTWTNGVTNGTAFTPTTTQTYVVTANTNGCTATDDLIVTVTNVDVSAGNDTLLCAGQNYVLQATGASSYSWSTGQANGSIFIPTVGSTTLTVTGATGPCTDTDDILITGLSCNWELTLPNVITPNNDGTNDFFEPIEHVNIVINQWVIVNRWGNTMIESTDPMILWKPAEIMEDDVLFYRVYFTKPDGTRDEKHGFFTVKNN